MKNNKLFFILSIVSGLILIIALILGFYISKGINKASESLNIFENKDADYHIMILMDKSNQVYSKSFERGVYKASEEFNIAVELIKIDGNNYNEEVLDRLDMAMYSKVDGIVVHAYDDERIIAKIEQASDMGIPVVTLNEDLAQSSRITYVGVNRYNIGLEVGKTIAKISGGNGKIAVIEQKGFTENSDDILSKTDLMILGIQDVFQNYNNLSLELIHYSEQSVLSAETITIDILREHPEINGIYCTDGQSTLGIIQVLIDKNRISDFILIGFGDDEEILNYIEKGNILEATIVTNYQNIGRHAVKAFYDYKITEIANSHVNTSIQVVDEKNIKAYIREKGETYEENE